MLIENHISVGFQCPICGNVETTDVKIFEPFSNGTKQIACLSCKKPIAQIIKHNKENYRLDILCIDCNEIHSFMVPIGEFYNTRLKAYNCNETEEPIFIIGKSEAVTECIKESFYGDDED